MIFDICKFISGRRSSWFLIRVRDLQNDTVRKDLISDMRKLFSWLLISRLLVRVRDLQKWTLKLDGNILRTVFTSIQQRTKLRFDLGVFSSIIHDDSTNSTSYLTFSMIKHVLKVRLPTNKWYLIVDESEIGMGEELVVVFVVIGLILFLVLFLRIVMSILVITHNWYIVENLKGVFLNFNGMTREKNGLIGRLFWLILSCLKKI